MPQLEVHFLAGGCFGFLGFLIMYWIDAKKLKKGISLLFPLLIIIFGFLACVPDFPSISEFVGLGDQIDKAEFYEHGDFWNIFFFHLTLDKAYGIGQAGPVIPAFFGIMLIYIIVFAFYVYSFKYKIFSKDS
ncbi:hypothetical protein KY311_03440 [Candidatus Woesearchaeota archaeon]|nr:hypothetical protein [Candidatus Woesearchaeota archaeon]